MSAPSAKGQAWSPAVERLLQDARLLLSHLTYESRIGNTDLADAIAAAEAAFGTPEEPARVASLRVELGK